MRRTAVVPLMRYKVMACTQLVDNKFNSRNIHVASYVITIMTEFEINIKNHVFWIILLEFL